MHTVDGVEAPLPPLVVGAYGRDRAKTTLLVYGHYDVQPALRSDGWATEPFTLEEDAQGRLYGRGSTDDKGPVLAWLWILQAHQQLGVPLPVNLRFVFEGMEESGSTGLDAWVHGAATGLLADVDCVCISDNYWLGKTKPCLTYGLRGVSYYTLEVSGPARDLHSGLFGGAVHEPMTDLVALMSRLVDPRGRILIPGVYDSVAPLTGTRLLHARTHTHACARAAEAQVGVDAEKARYAGIDFNLDDFHASIGASTTIHASPMDTLMHRWRYPSLSLHGIEGAFYGAGAKTVIPAKVVGKFSIRTVPDQDPREITRLVETYVHAQAATLGTKNTVKVGCIHDGRCWVSDVAHWNYGAAAAAIARVFGAAPDLTREGGSIPVTLTFQEALRKNVLLLPVGACDDGAHSVNEKIDRRNYIEGIKVLGAYLHELAAVARPAA
jgi:Cys-Gly metallodipeptidase DUG1